MSSNYAINIYDYLVILVFNIFLCPTNIELNLRNKSLPTLGFVMESKISVHRMFIHFLCNYTWEIQD